MLGDSVQISLAVATLFILYSSSSVYWRPNTVWTITVKRQERKMDAMFTISSSNISNCDRCKYELDSEDCCAYVVQQVLKLRARDIEIRQDLTQDHGDKQCKQDV